MANSTLLKIGLAAILALFLVLPGVGRSQEKTENKDAPQILTSDLFRKQVIKTDKLSVSFVFLDSDNIVEITINGQLEKFEPDNAIVVNKVFEIAEIEVVITVIATDEAGNKREKSYFVIRQEPPLRALPLSPLDRPPKLEPLGVEKPPFPVGPIVPQAPPPAAASFAVEGEPPEPEELEEPEGISVWPLWTGSALVATSVVLYAMALQQVAESQELAAESRTNDDADKYQQALDTLDEAESNGLNATIAGVIGGGLLIYYFSQDDPAEIAARFDPRNPTVGFPLVVEARPGAVSVGWRMRW